MLSSIFTTIIRIKRKEEIDFVIAQLPSITKMIGRTPYLIQLVKSTQYLRIYNFRCYKNKATKHFCFVAFHKYYFIFSLRYGLGCQVILQQLPL